jgi:hypothetical protein
MSVAFIMDYEAEYKRLISEMLRNEQEFYFDMDEEFMQRLHLRDRKYDLLMEECKKKDAELCLFRKQKVTITNISKELDKKNIAAKHQNNLIETLKSELKAKTKENEDMLRLFEKESTEYKTNFNNLCAKHNTLIDEYEALKKIAQHNLQVLEKLKLRN